MGNRGSARALANGNVTQLTDHLFREEAGKLVSILTRIFGIERLQLAEDVVQEALMRALKFWPYYGVPDNPSAWITRTAKNLAIDVIRREALFRDKQDQMTITLQEWRQPESPDDAARFETEIQDARLRLMFACCHPDVPMDSQIALVLKTVCGFGVTEIARSFLVSEAAIAKRLTRARNTIREHHIPFEIPAGAVLEERLEAVLQSIYLLFNEGYKSSTGDALIRSDLCLEAIRLGLQLTDHPSGNHPRSHALLALMLFNAARFPERLDATGNILQLEAQDRSRWDQSMLFRALHHLSLSAAGDEVTSFHLQAGIAACHCTAQDFASTDWSRILMLYNHLELLAPSPIVSLNRAIALAKVEGPQAGLAVIGTLTDSRLLESYPLSFVVRAELEAEMGDFHLAAKHLRRALELTENASERRLLTQRLERAEKQAICGVSAG